MRASSLCNGGIEREIGGDFTDVKKVADNIDKVIIDANNIDDIVAVGTNIDAVLANKEVLTNLSVTAESVPSTEEASATIVGSVISIKIPEGADGLAGVDGATGPTGATGPQGLSIKGDKGDTGLTGPAGNDGYNGLTPQYDFYVDGAGNLVYELVGYIDVPNNP